MALIPAILGSSGGGIDMSKVIYPPTGLQTVGAEGTGSDTFTFSVPEEPKCVFIQYLLSTASQYFRTDICDVVNNRVMMYNRTSSGVWTAPTIYQLTDEITYSSGTLWVKNKTNGSRVMFAVAFY